MYRENESAPFGTIKCLRSLMYCELISALVVLLINKPLLLSLVYHSQMYSMHLSESVGGLAMLSNDPLYIKIKTRAREGEGERGVTLKLISLT